MVTCVSAIVIISISNIIKIIVVVMSAVFCTVGAAEGQGPCGLMHRVVPPGQLDTSR